MLSDHTRGCTPRGPADASIRRLVLTCTSTRACCTTSAPDHGVADSMIKTACLIELVSFWTGRTSILEARKAQRHSAARACGAQHLSVHAGSNNASY